MSEEQSPEQPEIPAEFLPQNRKRGRPPLPALTDAEKQVVTSKKAQLGLQRFKAKYMKASQWGGAAEFGRFIRQKGKKNIGAAIEILAADRLKEGIERCDSLIAVTTDPELKVRLEEARKDYCDKLAKVGQSLGKNEGGDSGSQTNNKTGVVVFAPNVAVSQNGIVPTPEKIIDS